MQMTVANADIILWGIFAIVFVGLGSVAIGAGLLSSPDRVIALRAARLKSRLAPSSSEITAINGRRVVPSGASAGLDEFLKQILPRPEELRNRLMRTGRNISLTQYAITCLIVTIILAVALLAFAGMPWLTSLLLGIFGGVGLPYLVTGKMATKRLNKFTKLFPDAIDLIVRGLKSGLPVTESIQAVGTEMDEPVGIEFRRVANDVRLGKTLEDALWKATEKIDTPEFKFFVIALSVQRETGGNLAETLGNLSDILRSRQKMKLKIKAMSSEGKTSAIIIGSLPFIMLAIISAMNWDYASVLFTDPRARMALGGGVVWMSIGMLIIAKLIDFEI
jgi:tight adherence protein B